MGKFFGWLFVILIIASGAGYIYYNQTGYKFGLEDTFLFKDSIGISTTSFVEGEPIPIEFTCDGDNVSPKFTLTRIPAETKSLAFILEDESVKPNPFTHWLVFNIRPDVPKIDSSTIWQYGLIGANDYNENEYAGPCPPSGETHKYAFKVYALNIVIVSESQNRLTFDKVISSHVLASGSFVGVYSKKP